MNRTLRHTNIPSAARAMDEFLRQSTRAERLGFDMQNWFDRYMPSTDAPATAIYAATFRAKAELDFYEREVIYDSDK
jgi:hypothetical protein